jgi:hypothetical protein
MYHTYAGGGGVQMLEIVLPGCVNRASVKDKVLMKSKRTTDTQQLFDEAANQVVLY